MSPIPAAPNALLETPCTVAAITVPLDPALLPAGVLLITGVFMLLAGRRLLRTGLGITAALLGGLIGNAVGGTLIGGLPPVLWTGLGALLGLGLGLLLWRMTVASIMAASCAAVAGLSVLLAIHSGLIEPVLPTTTPEAAQTFALESLETEPTGEATAQDAQSLEAVVADAAAEEARSRLRAGLSAARDRTDAWLLALNQRLSGTAGRLGRTWETLAPAVRTALLGVAVLGGLFGFLFGLVAWKRAGTIVTVIAGSGLILIAGLILVEILVPGAETPLGGLHPALWLGGWAAVAVFGAGIQWLQERRSADEEADLVEA